MEFIFDRTENDVLMKTAKGRYDYTDLNRVEQDVKEIMDIMNECGYLYAFDIKTDWARPGLFTPATWPTANQMKRYLQNVWTLAEEFAAQAELPVEMANLTWQGANEIEKALQITHERLQYMIDIWRYSGEVVSEEEDE